FDLGFEGRRIDPALMAQSTRPSSRWTEKTAPHIVALRGKPAEAPMRLSEPTGRALTISLQTKILLSYLILGSVLLFAVPRILALLVNVYLAGAVILCLTLVVGYGLTLFIARVNRIVRLKASAVEISRGDLSKSVVSEEQKNLHDEIDD